MATLSLEERLAVLEAEVAELKRQQAAEGPRGETPWWEKIRGVFKDDPDYEEAMRLGRAYRNSLLPQDDEIC